MFSSWNITIMLSSFDDVITSAIMSVSPVASSFQAFSVTPSQGEEMVF